MDGKICRRDFVWLSINGRHLKGKGRDEARSFIVIIACCAVDNRSLIKRSDLITERPTNSLSFSLSFALKTHNLGIVAENYLNFLVLYSDHKIFKLKSKKLWIFFHFFSVRSSSASSLISFVTDQDLKHKL